jgi:acetoin utilization deacetylase AcuC-like enzyme
VTTALLTAPVVLQHDTGPDNPERPERVSHALAHLSQIGLLSHLAQPAAPAPPQPDDAVHTAIHRVHPPAHLAQLHAAIAAGATHISEPDNRVSPRSYAAATTSTACALQAADGILAGDYHNALCLVRPPGHHAEATHAMGFCLINHAAVLARHLQHTHALPRIAILDFDVHHGNGTQHIFEADPTVFYASLHQHPLYPGTGAATEQGTLNAHGTTLNIPLPAGTNDSTYLNHLEATVLPAIQAHNPDFLILSAGFDAHTQDPLGGLDLSTNCFAKITRLALDLAATTCSGRTISLLEGGYNLEALAHSIAAHTTELLA